MGLWYRSAKKPLGRFSESGFNGQHISITITGSGEGAASSFGSGSVGLCGMLVV